MAKLLFAKGEEVVILNAQGQKAGTGIVESYNIHKDKFRVWFQYPEADEQELIELPAILMISTGGKRSGLTKVIR